MTRPPPEDAPGDLLDERSARFAGRTSNEVERLRADALAGFEHAGLPDSAVAYVLEELETGRTPSTVAAAARALRGATALPVDAPVLVVAAIRRLIGTDDVVGFAGAGAAGTDGRPPTALEDMAATLAMLGPLAVSAVPALEELVAIDGGRLSAAVRAGLARALDAMGPPASATATHCCGHAAAGEAGHAAVPTEADRARAADRLADVELEDQDGNRLTFRRAFGGRPTVLGFFYTRCMNPEKCSLTVTRLAAMASRLDLDGLDANVAAITYDPGFDRPGRLRTYGADRGMAFTSRCALLRTVGPFDPVADAFALGVGFGPVTVNRHRIDLVVLDASLAVTTTFERRLWHEDAVVDALHAARGAAAPHACD